MPSDKLAQLQTGKTYNINGVEFVFKSIEVNAEVTKLMKDENAPEEQRIPAIKELIKKMILEAEPEATEEQLKDCMRITNLMPFIDAFYDVNGLNNEENVSKAERLKDAIRKQQQQRRST
jgi:hypothetical protein